MTDASIVIPLFNRADLTIKCLEAIERNTPPERYEVVIVDNGSTDETGDLLDALEGDVTILRNPKNLGFARACNQGAAAAGGEVIVFLNNDTEVQPGWLEALLEPLGREPGIGAVGARLLYPTGGVQHAGVVITERTDLKLLCPEHKLTDELTAWEPQAVTGAVMAVRSGAFAELGGFDEGYWNCFEDIDLCLRLGEAGWRILYAPKCVVLHHESASGPERHTGIPDATYRFGIAQLRSDPDGWAPGRQVRMVLQGVVNADVQCRCEGVQIGVHSVLQDRLVRNTDRGRPRRVSSGPLESLV